MEINCVYFFSCFFTNEFFRLSRPVQATSTEEVSFVRLNEDKDDESKLWGVQYECGIPLIADLICLPSSYVHSPPL